MKEFVIICRNMYLHKKYCKDHEFYGKFVLEIYTIIKEEIT